METNIRIVVNNLRPSTKNYIDMGTPTYIMLCYNYGHATLHQQRESQHIRMSLVIINIDTIKKQKEKTQQ